MFNINIIGRTYRHVQRYRQILTVLIKYGFDNFVHSLNIEQYLEIGLNLISSKPREPIESLSRAERMRLVVEELGPTFIKVGQILSTRPDLLPIDLIVELSKLQDRVPPFPFEDAKKIIAEELKQPITNIFSDLSEEPLAAASVGQVHQARLNSGEDVVIKVRRPQVERTIEIDLEIMYHIATLMENHLEGWDLHRPTQIVTEFMHSLEREMNYRIEAANMERFHYHFADDPTIFIPRVYREYTTPRMLTMQYINGIKASEIEQLDKAGYDRHKIAEVGAKIIMKQVFIHGFFHADPHPGNIFILPGQIICLLDFGMTGRLDRQSREYFADLLMAVVQRDPIKARRTLLRLTDAGPELDQNKLERDISEFMDLYCYLPLKELDMSRVLPELVKMLTKHRLRIPPDIFLMLKAFTNIEGLGRLLDPDFEMVRQAEPFVRRIQFNRYHPRRFALDAFDSSSEALHLLKEIPGELRQLLRQIKRGEVKVKINHTGMEPLLRTLDDLSNRLSFAIVLASLVIGSSLIIHSDIPPKWHEIPVIGMAGYLVAGIMGFWLLISMLRGGRM